MEPNNPANPQFFPRVRLGGTLVHLCKKSEFLHVVSGSVANDGPTLLVTSANLDHIHHFGRSDWMMEPEWVNLLDGAPLTWMASAMTGRIWPRLAGSDLIDDVLAIADEHGASVGFLGGRPSVHDLARSTIEESYTNLRALEFWSPSRLELDLPDVCIKLAREIRQAEIDVLFICLGKPRQETWMRLYGAESGAHVQLAFGASVDFLAGAMARAPSWMRIAGLEWLFRLLREPTRLGRRYLLQGPPALARLLYDSRPLNRL